MTDVPHVFVTQGDITNVACDAWLLPTDPLASTVRALQAVLERLGGERHQRVRGRFQGVDATPTRAAKADCSAKASSGVRQRASCVVDR